jgi:uncharacterized protein (UPF0335 family)
MSDAEEVDYEQQPAQEEEQEQQAEEEQQQTAEGEEATAAATTTAMDTSAPPAPTAGKKGAGAAKKTGYWISDAEKAAHDKLLLAHPVLNPDRFGTETSGRFALNEESTKAEKEAYDASGKLLAKGGPLPAKWKLVQSAAQTEADKARRATFTSWASMQGSNKFKKTENDSVVAWMTQKCNSLREEDHYQYDDPEGRPHWLLRASDYSAESSLRKEIPPEVLAKCTVDKIYIEKDGTFLSNIQYFVARRAGMSYSDVIKIYPRKVPDALVVYLALSSRDKTAKRKASNEAKTAVGGGAESGAESDAAATPAKKARKPSSRAPKSSSEAAAEEPAASTVASVFAKAIQKPSREMDLPKFDRSHTVQLHLERLNKANTRMSGLVTQCMENAEAAKKVAAQLTTPKVLNGINRVFDRFYGPNATDEIRTKFHNSVTGGILAAAKKDKQCELLLDLMNPDGTWKETADADETTWVRSLITTGGGPAILLMVHYLYNLVGSKFSQGYLDLSVAISEHVPEVQSETAIMLDHDQAINVAHVEQADELAKALDQIKKLEEEKAALQTQVDEINTGHDATCAALEQTKKELAEAKEAAAAKPKVVAPPPVPATAGKPKAPSAPAAATVAKPPAPATTIKKTAAPAPAAPTTSKPKAVPKVPVPLVTANDDCDI